MSKARLVITAVITEGLSQGEAARRYGASQGWVSRLLARYRTEGEAAFEPRSRRPKPSPNAISPDTADLIVRPRKELTGQGLDAGPQTIARHLEHHHQVRASAATISRTLSRHGLVPRTDDGVDLGDGGRLGSLAPVRPAPLIALPGVRRADHQTCAGRLYVPPSGAAPGAAGPAVRRAGTVPASLRRPARAG